METNTNDTEAKQPASAGCISRLVPLPCPFCGGEARVWDDYDERSGLGQKEKGWIECRCGAAMGSPKPQSPYPTILKAEVIAAWNLRHNCKEESHVNDAFYRKQIQDQYYNSEIRLEYSNWLRFNGRVFESDTVRHPPKKAILPQRLKVVDFDKMESYSCSALESRKVDNPEVFFGKNKIRLTEIYRFVGNEISLPCEVLSNVGRDIALSETRVKCFVDAHLTCNGAFFSSKNEFPNDNRLGHGSFLKGVYYDPYLSWHIDLNDPFEYFMDPVFIVQKHPMLNYYHFLVEHAPNFILYLRIKEQVPNLKIFLIENGYNSLFIQVAKLFGIDANDFIVSKSPLNKLKLCYRPNYANLKESGSFLTEKLNQFCSELDNRLPPYLVANDYDNRDSLVYISRSDAKGKREIANEDDLVRLLESYGFKTYTLSGMQFIDQVKLFRRSKIVIGAHGAGLTNVLFCMPGTHVVEITKPYTLDRVRIYWDLSALRQLRFSVLCASDSVEDHSSGITVDIDSLEMLLRDLIGGDI